MPPPTAADTRPTRDELDPAALELMRRHGPELMATARKWAATPEDAEDAYQRGLEILLTKAPTADPDELVPWLKTVVKHEAFAARRQSERHTPPAGTVPELLDVEGDPGAHDHAERFDRLRQGAEAMRRLKPQEVRALVLKAEGLTYREICDETGWTYTKVNRALSEGRKAFTARLAGIESGAECERLGPTLSALVDGEAAAEDLAALRPHLRTCLACRARLREYREAPARVAAIAPPLAAGSLLASARDLFDGAAGWISERSASLALRWHQAPELAAAHKVAAVAASTAVLAGGGAATMATVDGDPDPARSTAAAAAPAQTSPQPPFATSGVALPAAASDPDEHNAPRREQRPSEKRDPVPDPPDPPSGEFTPDSAAPAPAEAAPGPKPTEAAPRQPPAGADGGEFAP